MKERRFYNRLTTWAIGVLILSMFAYAQPSTVDIPDPNLRAAIADALNIAHGSPITQEDMNRLTDLDVRDQGIANLTGLEFATNLTFLQLKSNRIEDIRPLANLTQLTELHLGGNRIEDISPLANLTKLREADLDRNEIVDVSPLARLTNLESLDLRINRIIDVSPLANLMQLTELRLNENRIIDITPLANLTNLVALWLSDNRITDVTALANLTQLTQLRLSNNQIKDVSPLENLTNLEHLDTHNNPIFDPDSPFVEVRDPNLRTAVRETLNLPDGVPLTQASMRQLAALNVRGSQIESLAGLEHATNLTFLSLRRNRIEDIRPLANLTQLTELYLGHNKIEDVSPLANLTQLTQLDLKGNRIEDFSPLARLTNLESLDSRGNRGTDHSPLDGLALTEFLYDESCELAPFPVRNRIENRDYPSIFARWSGPSWPPILNRPELTGVEIQASHDLWFSVPMFDLRFEYWPEEIRVIGDLDEAIRQREEFLAINPNIVFLVQVRMRSGTEGYLPEDSLYWIRDTEGNIVECDLMDFTHPYIQDRIVKQAIAVSKCGLYDGIMFDWWGESGPVLADINNWSHKFRGNEAEQRARDNILRRVRAGTRADFLIMGNTEYLIPPTRTGPYMNGGFMEVSIPGRGVRTKIEQGLTAVENTLLWKEQNMREPRIIALEGEVLRTEPPDSPTNLRWMRAITTLSLTHSDGYVLFTSDLDDYKHLWYDFWDADLGRPVSEKGQLYQDTEGLYIREFTNGWAVYNHSGAAQVITLPEEVQGVASELVNTEHALANLDGEMYLRVKPVNPADVNGDGVVNILDLTLVAQGFGSDSLKGDVNGDGVVNVFDLVFVANEF